MQNQKRAKKTPTGKPKETESPAGMPKSAKDIDSARNFRKTSQRLCKSCKYHIAFSAGMKYTACYYIVRTQQSRDCPIGWCDKYEKGIPKTGEV